MNNVTADSTATQPLIKPIMQIGPDAIHMLRSISKQHTGERYTYDTARVQRNRFGGADTEINFNKLEMLEAGHPDSYGVFIKNKVTPQALKWHRRMARQDQSLVKYTMAGLLKEAMTEDADMWWMLSTNALRSVLFPAAFTDGKRTDRIFYYDIAGYKRQLGSALWLRGLSPKDVYQFHLQATAAVPSKIIDLDLITPFLNK